jgi:AraC-like DNA-binding protein
MSTPTSFDVPGDAYRASTAAARQTWRAAMTTRHPERSGALRGRERAQVAHDLARQFTDQKVTIAELAAAAHRPPSMVRRLLIEAGVQAESVCLGVSEERIAAILAYRYTIHGDSVDALSAITGIDHRVVRRLLDQAGVQFPQRHGRPVHLVGQLGAQYLNGASLRDLGDQAGCSYSTIRRLLRQHQVPLRESPGGGTGGAAPQ